MQTASFSSLGLAAIFDTPGHSAGPTVSWREKVKSFSRELRSRVQRERHVDAQLKKRLGKKDIGYACVFNCLAKDSKLVEEFDLSHPLFGSAHLPLPHDDAKAGEHDRYPFALPSRRSIDMVLKDIASNSDLTDEQLATLIRTLARQTVEAVQDMHAAGIHRRDIKPANFLLSREGSVIVGDLGLATMDYDLRGVAGTWTDLAPEITHAQQRADASNAAEDSYALGLALSCYLDCLPPRARSELGGIVQSLLAIEAMQRPLLDALLQHPYFQGRVYSGAELVQALDC